VASVDAASSHGDALGASRPKRCHSIRLCSSPNHVCGLHFPVFAQPTQPWNPRVSQTKPQVRLLEMARNPVRPLLYEYRPLPSPDTVRLIQLSPAPSISDPLDFEFVLHDRSTASSSGVSYDAVSYVWGSAPRFDHRIHLRSSGRYLDITATVDELLRSLRQELAPRQQPIWIDAICLNQADMEEKGVQVPLMGDIYHQARSVHIWLGGDDPEVKLAFEALHTISLRRARPQALMQHVRSTLSRICGDDRAGIASLRKLLHNPWFQRRWVIQEASLNHETIVHCGRDTIAWS